jgi:hypothetical protein
MRVLWAGVVGGLIAVAASGPGHAVPQEPSAKAQLLIYLLNRARSNPAQYQAEANLSVDISGVAPQPPLAVNQSLVGSATFHAEEMAVHNYFNHQSDVTGDWPNKMARDNGYVLPGFYPNDSNQIEAIAAGTNLDGAAALKLLIEDIGVDPPGHRIHLLAMDPFFHDHREIGAGVAFNNGSHYKNYFAIHTAGVSPNDRFLTGVVFQDANGNGRYDLNEGLGGVTVGNGSTNTTTNGAGGWSIQVPQGTYTVTAQGGAFKGTASAVATVSTANVEVDFISANPNGIVNFGQTPAGLFSVSGAVTLNGAGVGGVTVTAGGKSARTNAAGAYTLTGLWTGSHTVSASRPGLSFSPGSQSAAVGPNQSGVNFAAAFTAQPSGFTITPDSVKGGKKAKGTLTLSQPLPLKGTATATSANPAVVVVPATVKVGKSKAVKAFKIKTRRVAEVTPVVVSITFNGTTLQATLTVTP